MSPSTTSRPIASQLHHQPNPQIDWGNKKMKTKLSQQWTPQKIDQKLGLKMNYDLKPGTGKIFQAPIMRYIIFIDSESDGVATVVLVSPVL
jgi:hypothetical protein